MAAITFNVSAFGNISGMIRYIHTFKHQTLEKNKPTVCSVPTTCLEVHSHHIYQRQKLRLHSLQNSVTHEFKHSSNFILVVGLGENCFHLLSHLCFALDAGRPYPRFMSLNT